MKQYKNNNKQIQNDYETDYLFFIIHFFYYHYTGTIIDCA